ncbi:hypothetical protein SAMN05660199_04070 [Klenkia soli]|uniref:Uncharacterized protein n=2 Tax=Klenkia soli TaxID=1052260 RepID=A0A1H0TCP8_9ACTN|nr:hypothetical protein SAMN05660199_04070 [Klenkia soli]
MRADVIADVLPETPAVAREDGETDLMVLWPLVTLVGFLLLTGVVIAMGTHSTSRYEAEKRTATAPRARHAAESASAPVSA